MKYIIGPVLLLAGLAAGQRLAGPPPRGFDSGPTHHSGRMDANEVWQPSGNPHILDGNVYTGDGVTLTIMPACTVRAEYGVELYAGYADPGTIVAAGTADSVIVFTSNIPGPQPGDWRGIGIYGLARNATRFSYCDISYAGSRSGYGAFYVYGVEPRLDNCRISQSNDYGVKADHGARFGSFYGNTISGCANYPVSIQAGNVHTLGAGNSLAGNLHDGVLVNGGSVTVSGTWLNQGVPYVIDGSVAIGDASNTPILTIAAGTKLMFRTGCELYVGYAVPGGLIADGSTGQIEFTSAVVPPSRGDWIGVSFYPEAISSMCKLVNCKVEYGGDDEGNVCIDDCVPEIRGDSIGHSAAWGICVRGSEYPPYESLRWGNTFYDCASGAVGGPAVGVSAVPVGSSGKTEPATIACGVLRTGDRGRVTDDRAELLDISGRKVTDLHAGANDVSRLAPGIYFVREERAQAQAQAQAMRKVILTR
jgi:hypothetical protein